MTWAKLIKAHFMSLAHVIYMPFKNRNKRGDICDIMSHVRDICDTFVTHM